MLFGFLLDNDIINGEKSILLSSEQNNAHNSQPTNTLTTTDQQPPLTTTLSSTREYNPPDTEFQQNIDLNTSYQQTLVNYSTLFLIYFFNYFVSFLTNFYLLCVRLNDPKVFSKFIQNYFFSLSSYNSLGSFFSLFTNSSTNLANSIHTATTFVNPIRKVFDLDFEFKILIILLLFLSLTLASIAISWKIYSNFITNFKLSKGK